MSNGLKFLLLRALKPSSDILKDVLTFYCPLYVLCISTGNKSSLIEVYFMIFGRSKVRVPPEPRTSPKLKEIRIEVDWSR